MANIENYAQVGIGLRGLMGDPSDMAGLAFSYAFPTASPARDEKVVEVFYRWQLTSFAQFSARSRFSIQATAPLTTWWARSGGDSVSSSENRHHKDSAQTDEATSGACRPRLSWRDRRDPSRPFVTNGLDFPLAHVSPSPRVSPPGYGDTNLLLFPSRGRSVGRRRRATMMPIDFAFPLLGRRSPARPARRTPPR